MKSSTWLRSTLIALPVACIFSVAASAQSTLKGDVAFCIDESGSMGDEQAAIASGVPMLAASITASGVDGQYCLLGYGDSGVAPMVEQSCTADQSIFTNAVNNLVINGGTGPGFDCLIMAADPVATNQRPDAELCVVIVTDEPSNGDVATEADALAALTATNATLFGILETSDATTVNSYQNLITSTGGAIFSFADLAADPNALAADLGAACSAAVIIGSGGGEGCTPGYWKQRHHFDSWPSSLNQSDLFADVFGVSESGNLLSSLKQRGGKFNALKRHAVAAYLNASSADVSYEFTPAEVVLIVQEAYLTGDSKTAKNTLEAENEAGCPLN